MSFPLELDRPLVVFDIESTGINPRHDRIIELAAIRIEPDGTETSKCWLLNPGVKIPPETTAIHSITDDDVKDCPTFAEKIDEIEEFFSTYRASRRSSRARGAISARGRAATLTCSGYTTRWSRAT